MDVPDKYAIRSLGEYQRLMDVFETSQDGMTLPDLRLVLRVDAHRFGDSWDDEPESDYPFGIRFTDALCDAAKVMMACGLKTVFAYMHGDEVSLLLDEAESNNPRRKSRLISIASSVSTLAFQEAFGKPAAFFTKLSELPNPTRVLDYFIWQKKVAARNFLSRTLGLLLVEQGLSDEDVAARLKPLDDPARRALLVELGRTPDTVTDYEQFGLALWWELGSGASQNVALCIDDHLPQSDQEYLELLADRVFGTGYCCPESLESVEITAPRKGAARPTSPRPAPATQAAPVRQQPRSQPQLQPQHQPHPQPAKSDSAKAPAKKDVFRIAPRGPR